MSVKIKILVSVIAIVVAAVIGILFLTPETAKTNGTVIVELCDYENKCTEQEHQFNNGDIVSDILYRHYNVILIESEYGSYIGDIEDYIENGGDANAFIAFYVNDELSMVGINEVELYDGIKLSFKYETW